MTTLFFASHSPDAGRGSCPNSFRPVPATQRRLIDLEHSAIAMCPACGTVAFVDSAEEVEGQLADEVLVLRRCLTDAERELRDFRDAISKLQEV